ncbi:MAG TPA: hypothetical protein VMW79_07960 [Anaerolineae bacterium]|nr:hypothetical protein [Anaerolineae bacterium]
MNDATYIDILEGVTIAAWKLRKKATQKNLDRLDKALRRYDRILGWNGVLRDSKTGQWKGRVL